MGSSIISIVTLSLASTFHHNKEYSFDHSSSKRTNVIVDPTSVKERSPMLTRAVFVKTHNCVRSGTQSPPQTKAAAAALVMDLGRWWIVWLRDLTHQRNADVMAPSPWQLLRSRRRRRREQLKLRENSESESDIHIGRNCLLPVVGYVRMLKQLFCHPWKIHSGRRFLSDSYKWRRLVSQRENG